jgi:hypothetical protein
MIRCFQNKIFHRFGLNAAILALVLCAQVTLAQPPPPDDPNNVGGGTGGAGVPIDGGLSILLAAGAGLGLKKAWDARKSGTSEEPSSEQPTSEL